MKILTMRLPKLIEGVVEGSIKPPQVSTVNTTYVCDRLQDIENDWPLGLVVVRQSESQQLVVSGGEWISWIVEALTGKTKYFRTEMGYSTEEFGLPVVALMKTMEFLKWSSSVSDHDVEEAHRVSERFMSYVIPIAVVKSKTD